MKAWGVISLAFHQRTEGAVWPGYDLCVNEGSTEADQGKFVPEYDFIAMDTFKMCKQSWVFRDFDDSDLRGHEEIFGGFCSSLPF